VCLAPLLVALDAESRGWRRFRLGWLAGAVYWFGVCYWIQAVLETYGGVGAAGGWIVFGLFCLAKGLHWAVFGWLAGYLMRGWWAAPAVAALWTGIERTNGPFGFAWLCLGNAGIDMGVPLRLAPVVGVYGISFVFAMMNAALALVWLRRPRLHLAPLAALPLAFLLPMLPEPENGREAAVVVQPNIEEKQDWSRDALEDTIRLMSTLALNAAVSQNPGPNLILWPEAPVPYYYETDRLLRDQTAQLARLTRSALLFAGVGRGPGAGPRNSAYMLDSSGEFVGRYDKMYLVPFGEFVPPPFDLFVKQISDEAGEFVPGRTLRTFANSNQRIGLFICYESAFPHFVREFAASGATVLANLSNDGYFGNSAAREQHLSLVRMRAAENSRWLIRATNDGITATVDPAGRITQRLPAYQALAGRMRFSYRAGRTPYTQHGDWFAWSCLAVAALAAGWRMLRRDDAAKGLINGLASYSQ
jgi:apolipoprotein N-acyltransferase